MADLPQHIESYLQEAGFTATELMVLKKLLEGEAMTLREIAAKTGKSTGVLDQAMKKLLRKKIVVKKVINDAPRYLVPSIDAIGEWMKDDVQHKRDELKRRHEDFQSFIATIQQDAKRPDIEHFEGEEGLKKAYGKLLDEGKTLLHYKPVIYKEEEDPLRRFFINFFRARHQRGLFSKILAPDTALGRRYQGRDHFEYRETALLPEAQFPLTFEKIIAGDVVACIDHKEQKASFIRFPELAETERKFFGILWAQAKCRGDEVCEKKETEKKVAKVSVSTRTASGMREFFLSKKGLITILIFGLIAATMTYFLYETNIYLNTQRVREKAKAIAATAAPEFQAEDITEIKTYIDANKDVYKKLVEQLKNIRDRNEGVAYSYIMRPTSDPYYFQFVADADSSDITPVDEDRDGIIDTVSPGQLWLDKNPKDSAVRNGLRSPSADKSPYTDPWGAWISGHAPITDNLGNTVAVIGVDIEADQINQLTYKTFLPIYYFLGFFLLFIGIRLVFIKI